MRPLLGGKVARSEALLIGDSHARGLRWSSSRFGRQFSLHAMASTQLVFFASTAEIKLRSKKLKLARIRAGANKCLWE